MPLPDFLVIGAMKAGTTSLFHYLRQHPQLAFGHAKEPSFFAFEGSPLDFRGPLDERLKQVVITQLSAYTEQYDGAKPGMKLGDVSPIYMYSERAAERIRERIPGAKLIAILRDPADRAYSNYVHFAREGREPAATFEAALEQEAARIAANWAPQWHYQRLGFYAVQLKRYLALFPRAQMRFFLYEDLRHDEPGVLRQIFDFVGVDPAFVPRLGERWNVGGVVKSRAVHNFLRRPGWVARLVRPIVPRGTRQRIVLRLMRLNLRPAPPMRAETREMLVRAYRIDIEELQRQIDRDLGAWLRA